MSQFFNAVTAVRLISTIALFASGAHAQANHQWASVYTTRVSSAPDTVYNSEYNVVTQWNQMALELVKEAKPAPPVVARSMAITHTCIFDAWSTFSAGAKGLYFNLQGEFVRPAHERKDDAKSKAISAAAATCLRNLFPSTTQSAAVSSLLARYGVNSSDLDANANTPAGLGTRAAQAVIEARRNDGANQYGNVNCTTPTAAYCDSTRFVPSNAGATPITQINPNKWQPLPNGAVYQRPLAPHWGAVTPFVITSPSAFLADHPLPSDRLPALYPGVEYLKQVEDTLVVSQQLTRERKSQAILWADGPFSYLPPGHWNKVSQWVVNLHRLSIDRSVQFFAGLNWAMADAGIVSWKLKYEYDYVRPITAVRFVKNNQTVLAWGGPETPYDPTINPATGKPFGFARYIQGQDFNPYNPTTNPNHPLTPAFPEYTSGHSVFSMASALFMERFLKTPFMGIKVHFNPNDPEFREANPESASLIQADPNDPTKDFVWFFPTFRSAAIHAGNSRIVSGIHFDDGNIASQLIGARLGERAASLVNGLAPSRGNSPWIGRWLRDIQAELKNEARNSVQTDAQLLQSIRAEGRVQAQIEPKSSRRNNAGAKILTNQ
jgi:hypothetical protein